MLRELSVFLPAYNEEKNIRASVERAVQALPLLAERFEVIVVDDGSSDLTPAIVGEIAGREARVRLVRHERNKGYGEALKTGFASARYEYVFFTDSDQQFDISELSTFLPYAKEYDAVIGYRKKRQDHFMRLVNAWVWNMLNRILFGLSVRDIDCAFKLIRKEKVATLTIISGGAMTSAEILIKLHEGHARIKELPVKHFPRTGGSATGAKLSVILRALREMWQLYSVEMGGATRIQFLKFAAIGVVNTLTTIGAYIAITRLFEAAPHYLLAEALAYLCGTVISFVLNRLWTFRRRDRVTLSEVVRFYTAVVSALCVNIASVYVFVEFFGLQDIFAVILAALVTMVWNFTLFKYWVWRREAVGK